VTSKQCDIAKESNRVIKYKPTAYEVDYMKFRVEYDIFVNTCNDINILFNQN